MPGFLDCGIPVCLFSVMFFFAATELVSLCRCVNVKTIERFRAFNRVRMVVRLPVVPSKPKKNVGAIKEDSKYYRKIKEIGPIFAKNNPVLGS
jgi:hypothetical protein